MSDFKKFANAINKHFEKMADRGPLFVMELPEDLYTFYLLSFPEGADPIYRVRTVHDCVIDKHFIRRVGNVVSIVGDTIDTIWDVDYADIPHPYDIVAEKMRSYIKTRGKIASLFLTKEKRFGQETSVGTSGASMGERFEHFYCSVPREHQNAMPDKARGEYATAIGVFERGMNEISADALTTVVELIENNSLYRGEENLGKLRDFQRLHSLYKTTHRKDIFLWGNASNQAVARLKNSSLGDLLIDLSDGVELERAVRKYDAKVAPQNYKRTTAPITESMIKTAMIKLHELDLESAVHRRHAKLNDISVNDVLFVDNSVAPRMKDGLEALLHSAVKPVQIDIKNAEDVHVQDFLQNVVPQCSSIQLSVKNEQFGNFMTLTAPIEPSTGRLFKWNNDFAWSYDGDVTDSIKERVKAAGGKVSGHLRVSLAWHNYDDLDLHCEQPDRSRVSYMNKLGILDVDMNAGGGNTRTPVENMIWQRNMKDGIYKVSVNNFAKRENVDVGFTLEVEHAGGVMHYTYDRAVGSKTTVLCVAIEVRDNRVISITPQPHMAGRQFSQEKWGITSNTLVTVDTLLASPNHWEGNAVGNKHWFFILKGCKNPDPVRGIYNEYLNSALEPHRKVFEVLGAKTKAPCSDDQMSGIGFSSTRSDTATVIAKGSQINKAFNIKF